MIINDCKFENNTSPDGGAIFNQWGSATIINCEFNKNTADTGGAIYLSGDDGGDVTIKNSKFIENKASLGNAFYAYDGEITFEKNTINTAEADIVIDYGNIYSNTTATVLEGRQEIPVKCGDIIKLNATLTDDNGNLIQLNRMNGRVSGGLNFIITNEENPINATSKNGNYTADYTIPSEEYIL